MNHVTQNQPVRATNQKYSGHPEIKLSPDTFFDENQIECLERMVVPLSDYWPRPAEKFKPPGYLHLPDRLA